VVSLGGSGYPEGFRRRTDRPRSSCDQSRATARRANTRPPRPACRHRGRTSLTHGRTRVWHTGREMRPRPTCSI